MWTYPGENNFQTKKVYSHYTKKIIFIHLFSGKGPFAF